jgi:Na+/melibiose symporter-like transporter
MLDNRQSSRTAIAGNWWQREAATQSADATSLPNGLKRVLQSDHASSARLTAFSALALPIAAVQVPLGAYLPAILAQHYAISLTTLGMIFLLAKSWGVLTDPLVGALSDRTRNTFGRRRSWIFAGGSHLAQRCCCFFFLWFA